MPIYEFECSACSKVSEHIMKISDSNPTQCPLCLEEKTLQKRMSRTSFVLKGNGWYETDFKGTPKKEPSTASSSSSSPAKKPENTSNKGAGKASAPSKKP